MSIIREKNSIILNVIKPSYQISHGGPTSVFQHGAWKSLQKQIVGWFKSEKVITSDFLDQTLRWRL